MFSRLASCLVLLSVLGVFSGTATVSAQDGPVPVVIDSDMTTDDWMATLFLLNDPDFAVKAITVAGTGFAYCDAGVQSALGILALADYGDVPVSCGSEKPLMGDNAPPAEWRTTTEVVDGLGLPKGGEPAAQDAVALFTSTIQDSPEPVTVLALGPLTNIAAALEATPELVEKIEMIYVMGGAVDVDGSMVTEANSAAEWNIYCDPHAARLVFESGAPITLVPLDATNEMPVTPEFVDQLDAEEDDARGRIRRQAARQQRRFDRIGQLLLLGSAGGGRDERSEPGDADAARRDGDRHPRRAGRRPHQAGRQRLGDPRRHGAGWRCGRGVVDRRVEFVSGGEQARRRAGEQLKT